MDSEHAFYGTSPRGPLVIDGDGAIWGTAASSVQPITSVFKYAPATATFTNVFIGENNTFPLKSAFVGTISKTSANNIRFLGTETTHDNLTYSSQRAVIYEANPTTNAATKVRVLAEGVSGSVAQIDFEPAGGLYQHSDGNLYGITTQSGTDDKLKPAGGGMIYRVRSGPAAMTQGYSSTTDSSSTLFTKATQTLILRGVVNPNGNATTCLFEWGPTTALGNTLIANLSSGTGTGYTSSIYTAAMTGLPSNRTLFYRIRANSSGAASFGPILAVQTGPPLGMYPTPEISVESPIGLGLIDNATSVNLGSQLVGRSNMQQFVVRNLGDGDPGAGELNGLTATVTGANIGDFVITRPLSATTLTSTLTSAGLLITFTPSSIGVRSAMLTITSNDSNEGSFEIPLTGIGLVQPEIEVDSPVAQAMQSDAGSYDFGSGATNAGIARNFTIRNTGNAALAGLSVSFDGINGGDFAVTSQPPSSIAAGDSATFTVTLTPSLAANRVAKLHIASTDADENPFNIQVGGTGVIAPEIEVQADSGGLTDGVSTLAFGHVATATTVSKTITIRNPGSSTLTGISLSLIGANPADFSTGTVAASVAAGGQTTFLLNFTPQAQSARAATLRIASSDGDENPFDIFLTGNDTPAASTIESWRQTWFGASANTGTAADNADPDGDGYVNLMEFALAMNPTLSTTPLIATGVVGGNIEFTYTRSKAAVISGLNFQVPWTETLAASTWIYSDTTEKILSDNGTLQTVKATIPAGSAGSRFVRLEVH